MGNPLGDVVGRLRAMAAVQTLGGLSDGDLLERFVASCDEAAFAVLVDRHGTMVLGVCRRVLTNRDDAEDACQAAFLVLARKAGSLRKKDSLCSWLHGVASRIAANVKRDAGRRRGREVAAPRVQPDPATEVSWREVRAALDEGLASLPERYRSPLILCYLDSLTRDEAARRLGITPGALHGRLERGRDLLRDRLTKRGLALSAVLSAATLVEGAAHGLPPSFVVCSAKAAVSFAAGQPLTRVVGANVVALTREVLMGMFVTKVKLGAAAVLCVALALAGGSVASLGFAQEAKTNQPGEAVVPKGEGDEAFIRRLSKALRESDPTPAEVHFFASSKDPKKRRDLIDLFIKERQAKKGAAAARDRLIRDREALVIYDEARRRHAEEREARSRAAVAEIVKLVETADGVVAKDSRQPALQKEFFEWLQSAARPQKLPTGTSPLKPRPADPGSRQTRGGRIRAVVNGEAILDEEVVAAGFQQLMAPGLDERTKAEILNKKLTEIIERELLLQDAAARLGKRKGFMDELEAAANKEFEKQWLLRLMVANGKKDLEEFKRFLQDQGMPLEMIRRQWVRNFIAMEYIRSRIEPSIEKIGDAEVKEKLRRKIFEREMKKIINDLKSKAIIEIVREIK